MAGAHPHSHTHHSGDDLVVAAQRTLTAAGEQWTDMRAAVFRALAAAGQPASAYDVAEAVGRDLGRRVAANSVYRILDLFVATNVAMRVESRNAYVANAHPDCLHDCIFLVCDGCGTTTHIDDDRLSEGVAGPPAAPVSAPTGRSSRCADAAPRA